jgi:ABC-type multidrug transport system ATPase subunit
VSQLLPNPEPDEPTKVEPAAVGEQPRQGMPVPDSAPPVPPAEGPKAVRKPPARKPAARTTTVRSKPANGKPAANPDTETAGPGAGKPAADKTNAIKTAARTSAAKTAGAKSESATRSGAARASAARTVATRAAATRAAAAVTAAELSSATALTVPEAAIPVPQVAEPAPAVPAAGAFVTPAAVPVAAADVAPVAAVQADRAPGRLAAQRMPIAGAALRSSRAGPSAPVVIAVSGLMKSFGQTVAVSGIDLEVRAGSFFGIVGPNGAGKTTTLSMITGLLRPDSGSILVNNIDVWAKPIEAKRIIGVLPDRLRLFDRLTGAQLLYYSGVLRGLDHETVRVRSADLAAAFGLEDALNRLVADYSAGMTKKIALACAMIHSPRVLVLDEPFESVDPVSAVNVTEILQKYVASGGTVVLSSHGMDLIQRVCDHVAIIVQGKVLASGTIDEVRGEKTLEARFVELAGGRKVAEGMEWLHSFSD